MRTLLKKELREMSVIVAIALLAGCCLVGNWTRWWSRPELRFLPGEREPVPFLSGHFAQVFAIATLILGGLVGFWQTIGEELRHTWPFVLFRPVTRRQLLGSKLIAGLIVVGVCSAIPVLGYGLWAAGRRHHASPFEWSMTTHTWHAWWWGLVMYLAAFLSGIRVARWWGTRFVPIFAVLLLWMASWLVPADGPAVSLIETFRLIAFVSGTLAPLACLLAIDDTFEQRDFS